MQRKDCDIFNHTVSGGTYRQYVACTRRLGGHRISKGVSAVIVMVCLAAVAPAARGGSIRMWPEAVVVEDVVRLDDLCQLSGFSEDQELELARVAVTGAPEAGGSVIVHLDMIRSALTSSGVNMARVTMGGAAVCAVSRPAKLAPSKTSIAKTVARQSRSSGSHTRPSVEDARNLDTTSTLRQAIVDFFNDELMRYEGRAEVTFDRTSEQILDLSGPDYDFVVRRRNGPPLGLVNLEVVVLADGVTVQTVSLVASVSMVRATVVARGPINRSAVIRESDVKLMEMAFGRIDRIGISRLDLVIGQRAKRFMPPGTMVAASDLEQVLLVTRGQVVTLEAVEGSITVVTTGKAVEGGHIGDVIAVRDLKNRRTQYDAVIVAPGRVRIGSGAILRRTRTAADLYVASRSSGRSVGGAGLTVIREGR